MKTAGDRSVPDREPGAAVPAPDGRLPEGAAPWEWSVIVSRLISTGPWSVGLWSVGTGESGTAGVDLTGGGDPWKRT